MAKENPVARIDESKHLDYSLFKEYGSSISEKHHFSVYPDEYGDIQFKKIRSKIIERQIASCTKELLDVLDHLVEIMKAMKVGAKDLDHYRYSVINNELNSIHKLNMKDKDREALLKPFQFLTFNQKLEAVEKETLDIRTAWMQHYEEVLLELNYLCQELSHLLHGTKLNKKMKILLEKVKDFEVYASRQKVSVSKYLNLAPVNLPSVTTNKEVSERIEVLRRELDTPLPIMFGNCPRPSPSDEQQSKCSPCCRKSNKKKKSYQLYNPMESSKGYDHKHYPRQNTDKDDNSRDGKKHMDDFHSRTYDGVAKKQYGHSGDSSSSAKSTDGQNKFGDHKKRKPKNYENQKDENTFQTRQNFGENYKNTKSEGTKMAAYKEASPNKTQKRTAENIVGSKPNYEKKTAEMPSVKKPQNFETSQDRKNADTQIQMYSLDTKKIDEMENLQNEMKTKDLNDPLLSGKKRRFSFRKIVDDIKQLKIRRSSSLKSKELDEPVVAKVLDQNENVITVKRRSVTDETKIEKPPRQKKVVEDVIKTQRKIPNTSDVDIPKKTAPLRQKEVVEDVIKTQRKIPNTSDVEMPRLKEVVEEIIKTRRNIQTNSDVDMPKKTTASSHKVVGKINKEVSKSLKSKDTTDKVDINEDTRVGKVPPRISDGFQDDKISEYLSSVFSDTSESIKLSSHLGVQNRSYKSIDPSTVQATLSLFSADNLEAAKREVKQDESVENKLEERSFSLGYIRKEKLEEILSQKKDQLPGTSEGMVSKKDLETIKEGPLDSNVNIDVVAEIDIYQAIKNTTSIDVLEDMKITKGNEQNLETSDGISDKRKVLIGELSDDDMKKHRLLDKISERNQQKSNVLSIDKSMEIGSDKERKKIPLTSDVAELLKEKSMQSSSHLKSKPERSDILNEDNIGLKNKSEMSKSTAKDKSDKTRVTIKDPETASFSYYMDSSLDTLDAATLQESDIVSQDTGFIRKHFLKGVRNVMDVIGGAADKSLTSAQTEIDSSSEQKKDVYCGHSTMESSVNSKKSKKIDIKEKELVSEDEITNIFVENANSTVSNYSSKDKLCETSAVDTDTQEGSEFTGSLLPSDITSFHLLKKPERREVPDVKEIPSVMEKWSESGLFEDQLSRTIDISPLEFPEADSTAESAQRFKRSTDLDGVTFKSQLEDETVGTSNISKCEMSISIESQVSDVIDANRTYEKPQPDSQEDSYVKKSTENRSAQVFLPELEPFEERVRDLDDRLNTIFKIRVRGIRKVLVDEEHHPQRQYVSDQHPPYVNLRDTLRQHEEQNVYEETVANQQPNTAEKERNKPGSSTPNYDDPHKSDNDTETDIDSHDDQQ